MIKLPRLSGRACVSVLEKAGLYQKRQHGSHIILRRDGPFERREGEEKGVGEQFLLKLALIVLRPRFSVRDTP